MSIEESKNTVRRLIDALNRLDQRIVDEVCSPELARDIRERLIPWSLYTFGETHHAEITDMVAEGDKVWVRLVTSGDHVGEWWGIPPTYRKWTNTGVDFVRLEGGRIVEIQGLFDVLNHLQQLGATITPPEATK